MFNGIERGLFASRVPSRVSNCAVELMWTNVCLLPLQDDGPRDNPSDSEPSPIALRVDSLVIHRRDDGAFSIGGENPPPPTSFIRHLRSRC